MSTKSKAVTVESSTMMKVNDCDAITQAVAEDGREFGLVRLSDGRIFFGTRKNANAGWVALALAGKFSQSVTTIIGGAPDVPQEWRQK